MSLKSIVFWFLSNWQHTSPRTLRQQHHIIIKTKRSWASESGMTSARVTSTNKSAKAKPVRIWKKTSETQSYSWRSTSNLQAGLLKQTNLCKLENQKSNLRICRMKIDCLPFVVVVTLLLLLVACTTDRLLVAATTSKAGDAPAPVSRYIRAALDTCR